MIVAFLAAWYSASKSKGMVCLLSPALLSTPAWTQTQLGTIFGIITDTTGAVLPGVKVMVLSLGTGLKRDVTTDMGGQYQYDRPDNREVHGSPGERRIPDGDSRRSRADCCCGWRRT